MDFEVIRRAIVADLSALALAEPAYVRGQIAVYLAIPDFPWPDLEAQVRAEVEKAKGEKSALLPKRPHDRTH